MSRNYKGYTIPTAATKANWADIAENKDVKMIDGIETAQNTATTAKTAADNILTTYNSEKQNYINKNNLKQGTNVNIVNEPNGDITLSATDTKPNNATITLQKNGENVDNFTTNAASNKTINLTVTKTDVGLGSVDNTSDLNKPISTAVQAALDNKANETSIAFAVQTETNRATAEEQRIEDLTAKNAIAIKAEEERASGREYALEEALSRTHANTGALEFVGIVYRGDELPEDVLSKIKVGTFWLKRNGSTGMPDFDTPDGKYLNSAGDLLWYNGSDFEQYREGKDYQEKIFHLWSNLDDGQGYYRFGYKWHILNLDMDLYATKAYVQYHLESYYTQSETDDKIHEAVTPRLLPENIFAGENIELEQVGKNITVSATDTIPNNATINLQLNGEDIGSFTVDAADNKTINITVTKTDVGLGSVDNTSDTAKPISTATQNALNNKVNTTQKVNNVALGTGDITVTAAPSGNAGGDLGGTYPNPNANFLTGTYSGNGGAQTPNRTPLPKSRVYMSSEGGMGFITWFDMEGYAGSDAGGRVRFGISKTHNGVLFFQRETGYGTNAWGTLYRAAFGTDVTAATKTKITYNSLGSVTAGADLVASDIPNLDASKITGGTLPTTRGGWGRVANNFNDLCRAAGVINRMYISGSACKANGGISSTLLIGIGESNDYGQGRPNSTAWSKDRKLFARFLGNYNKYNSWISFSAMTEAAKDRSGNVTVKYLAGSEAEILNNTASVMYETTFNVTMAGCYQHIFTFTPKGLGTFMAVRVEAWGGYDSANGRLDIANVMIRHYAELEVA